jgi:hypothetical protein
MRDDIMTEIELNQTDKENLKADIKLTLIISFVLCLALVVLIFIIPLTLYLFGKNPTDGFLKRGLYVIGLLFLPFIFISWTNIRKYFDLKKGRKSRFETSKYEIKKKRDSVIIRTFEPQKLKFEIFTDVDKRLDPSRPLTIEFVAISKTVLFISNNDINSLDPV